MGVEFMGATEMGVFGVKKLQLKTVALGVVMLASNLLLPASATEPTSKSADSFQDSSAIALASSSSASSSTEPASTENTVTQNALAENTHTVATPEAILAEINRARQSPADYAIWLASLRGYYEGAAFRFPGERGMRTADGVMALDGAISALSRQSPLPPLTLAPGLVQSTQGHLNELLTHNRFTLAGLDGSSPLERAQRYGSLEGGRLNELLNEGLSSAEAIVAFLIIDDGNRTHSVRNALLSAEVTTLGAACERGDNTKPLCVLDYATAYETTPDSRQVALSQTTMPSFMPAIAQTSAQVPNQIADKLPQLATDLIAETNELRANPAAYAQKLIAMRQYYQGNLVAVPGQPLQEVVEGIAALDEAIIILQSSAPLPLLNASNGMSRGAQDHALDLGFKDLVGHYGSDNSDPFVRISRYGKWNVTPGNMAGENISYGYKASAEWHIIQLLIDDNVPDRGHRKALLNPNYQRMGSACAPHPSFDIVCVMTYASEYEEN